MLWEVPKPEAQTSRLVLPCRGSDGGVAVRGPIKGGKTDWLVGRGAWRRPDYMPGTKRRRDGGIATTTEMADGAHNDDDNGRRNAIQRLSATRRPTGRQSSRAAGQFGFGDGLGWLCAHQPGTTQKESPRTAVGTLRRRWGQTEVSKARRRLPSPKRLWSSAIHGAVSYNIVQSVAQR